MKMKKFLCLILTCLFSNVFLLGCNRDPYKIEKVDGYSIIKIRNRDAEGVALVGVDDSNLINNTLIVPEKIAGKTVLSLGYKKDSLWPVDYDETTIPLEFNQKMQKIVINNAITVLPWSLRYYTNTLKEIDLNYFLLGIQAQPYVSEGLHGISAYVASASTFLELIRDSKQLKKIEIDVNRLTLLYSQDSTKLLFYKISNTTIISDTFEKYTSLAAFIIPETVTEIDKNSFMNSTVDIYARAEKEDMSDSMNNGWDNDLNVTYGFKDEIVVFDSFDGSPVVFEETGKNYVVAQKGQKITPPEAPARDGYVFEGWFTDYVYSKEWNFETDAITDSTLLIAKWAENAG